MGAAKRRESLEEQLLAARGSLGSNPTGNVRFVLLEPQEPAPRFDAKDGEAFRGQLFELIAAIDSRYEQERGWWVGVGSEPRSTRGQQDGHSDKDALSPIPDGRIAGWRVCGSLISIRGRR